MFQFFTIIHIVLKFLWKTFVLNFQYLSILLWQIFSFKPTVKMLWLILKLEIILTIHNHPLMESTICHPLRLMALPVLFKSIMSPSKTLLCHREVISTQGCLLLRTTVLVLCRQCWVLSLHRLTILSLKHVMLLGFQVLSWAYLYKFLFRLIYYAFIVA